MEKFILSLGIIALGLAVGQTVRYMSIRKIIKDTIPLNDYVRFMQRLAILGLNPIVTIGAFWIVKVNDMRFIVLPFLGVAALMLGGVIALLFSKLLKHDRKKTGAMFASGSFSNLTGFGSLICFVFLGETSYAFVSMYKLFEDVVYYGVGFPIAKSYSSDCSGGSEKISSKLKVLFDPYVIVSLSSIIVGCIFNVSKIERPDVYSTINAILIPLISFLFVSSVGFNMRFSAVGSYIRECLSVSIIKFMLVPAFIVTTAYLLGIGQVNDGLVLKVVLIMSTMPPAFNSLIPPQIYGLDGDLANSSWLFNTGALVVVLPAVYFMLNFV